MMEGDLEGVDVLMKDEEGKSQLRITQRLRLDQVNYLFFLPVSSLLAHANIEVSRVLYF